VSPNAYPLNGGGVNLYISAVQVLELRQGGARSPFEAEEGYEAPKAKETVFADDNNADLDDDLPF
jgi:hypothetical protein